MSRAFGWRSLSVVSLLLLVACAGAHQAPSPTSSANPVPAALPAVPPAPTAYPEVDGNGHPIPPVAPRKATRRTLHGHTLSDDYAWLREREDPEVLAYLRAENRYAERAMAHTRGLQEDLYRELVRRMQETDVSVHYRQCYYLYYTRTEEGKQYPLFCRKRGGLDGDEEVMLDHNLLAEGHAFLRLGKLEVSPDGRLLAYGVDTDGSERFTIRFKDLATGQLLPDTIEEASWDLAWGNDSRTFFYLTMDATYRPDRLWRHALGSGALPDDLVYQEGDRAFSIGMQATRSRKFLLMVLESATTTEVRALDADLPGGDFRVVAPRLPGVEHEVAHHGEHFFIRSNVGARNFKLLRAPVADPGRQRWQEVVPERADVTLAGVEAFAHHLVLLERRDGLLRIRVRGLSATGEWSGEGYEVDFPEPLYTVRLDENHVFDTEVLRLRYTSLVTPLSIFDFHLGERTRELLKQTEVPGGYHPADYASERTAARAADGSEIPISLVYRQGFARDGSAPCLLFGYGSYGSSTEPRFSASRLALLDRGFLFAIAHVRGGGENGEAWHDGGKLMSKRNTFTDFIAAAEHLVAAGYTSPRRLAIQGRSAGGLLIGAVLNLRPDLFAAAIAQVPFVDLMNTMLDPELPLTVVEYEEWGNPNEPAAFDYMLSYSPYDNVRAQAYPRLLISGGLNDSRVSYWEPAKWAAKLRAVKTDDNPLLLKINLGAGHSGASGRYQALEELAFDYAFLLDSLGVGPPAAGSP